MAIEKTISLVGTLQQADVVSRIKLDDISMSSWQLTKLFEYEATLPAPTSNDPVDFQNATVATFLFVRVDVVDGGDCTIKITVDAAPDPDIVLPLRCDGGELWLNKTKIKAVSVSTVSGADVKIIGGGVV